MHRGFLIVVSGRCGFRQRRLNLALDFMKNILLLVITLITLNCGKPNKSDSSSSNIIHLDSSDSIIKSLKDTTKIVYKISPQLEVIPLESEDIEDNIFYTWVTFLSESKILWSENDSTRSVAFRVLITTSEIYNYIYIEKITYGEEGFGKRIEYRSRLNTIIFSDKFKITGEFTGVKFSNWISYNSFIFTIDNKRFELTILNQNEAQILLCDS
ncbi:MAG: hypothetical protein HUU10_07190 [Bacteroidetes bacterium]|nr:hypothetical protein [Bacteroidota bacterium]